MEIMNTEAGMTKGRINDLKNKSGKDLNIILIGMPGAGKSTVGVLAAKALGKNFEDTDILLQNNSGVLLFQILEKAGIGGFIKAEEETVLSLFPSNCVIATGGSVVLSKPAVGHLKSLGAVVYLRVPLCEIKKRLSDISSRGIVIAPGETVEMLFEKREKLYEDAADYVIECAFDGEETVEKSVLKLINLVKRIKNS